MADRHDALADIYNDARHGIFYGRTSDPEAMRLEHEALLDAGVLDPDQPTPYSHYLYQQALGAEFTPLERMQMRAALDCFDLADADLVCTQREEDAG